LVGLLLKRTRFEILAYPIAGLSLLSYETAFLPFIVFPLFFLGRKNRIGRGLMHLAGCGIALLIVFGIRLYLVDSRASSVVSSPGEMLWRVTSSLWLGPEASLKTLAKAFLEGPHTQNPFAFLFAALVGVLLVALPRFIVEPAGVVDEAANRSQSAQVFFAGLACWVFAYALTLINYPPTQTAGRLTSTHVSAVFGLACAMAAAVAYLRSLRRPTLKIVTTGTAVALVGLLTLYSFRIQSGFAAAWEKEKHFWRQIVDLCPDISPNTRIILLGLEPRQNEFVLSNSWADSLVLKSIFIGRGSPFLFYYEGLANSADIRFENGEVTWKPFFWVDKRETLNLDEVIILRENGEDMTRIKEFQIPGIPFPLHSKPLVSIQPEPYPSPLTNFGQFLLTR
jgi:hypothetical protein